MSTQLVSSRFDHASVIGQNEKRLFLFANIALILSFIAAGITGSVAIAVLPLILVVLPILISNLVLAWYIAFGFVIISQEAVVPGVRAGIQVPTEPLILLILFLWIIAFILRGEWRLSVEYLDVPLLGLFGLLGFSTIISTHPLVTFKSTLNTMWYVGIGYFFFKTHFQQVRDIRKVVGLFLILSIFVASVVLFRHSAMGFASSAAGSFMVEPFFPEHGSYAAYLCFAFAIALSLTYAWSELSKQLKILVCVSLPVTLLGIVFSYTRGAWLGVVMLFLFFFAAKLRRMFRLRSFFVTVVLVAIIAGGIAFSGASQILERNLNSIFRADANVSNLERFNRWSAAIDMFRAYPLTGVGYGTYAQNYFGYRNVFLKTALSGNMMRAHNEYLTVLAELGFVGALIFGWLLFRIFKTGIRVFVLGKDLFTKHLALGALGGILTYLVHGFFNSFLEFDKVAFPFWMLVGLLAILEARQRNPLQVKTMA